MRHFLRVGLFGLIVVLSVGIWLILNHESKLAELPRRQDELPKSAGQSHTLVSGQQKKSPDGFEALALNGSVVEVEMLVAHLKDEKDAVQKEYLRQMLGSVTNPDSFDLLLKFYATDPDFDVSSGSGVAVVGMLTGRNLKSLVQLYETLPAESAKRVAQLVHFACAPDALPVLAEILNSPGIDLRDYLSQAALGALVKTGTPYAAAVLARRLDRTTAPEDETILTQALSSVSQSGTENELIAIAQGKQDATRSATRVGAIRALANYPLSQVRGALQQLVTDPEPLVASTAASVLKSFSEK